jgi:hypothetical protein
MLGNTGIGVWVYNDMNYHVKTWDDLPFISIIPGPGHDWKGDGDRGWCAEPRMVENANNYSHALQLSWRSKRGCGCGSSTGTDTLEFQCDWWRGHPTVGFPVSDLNEAFIAFTNNSKNLDIGDTQWVEPTGLGGDSCGCTNQFVTFDKASLQETVTEFKVVVWASKGSSSWDQVEGTADITPRRCQAFAPDPWEVCRWYQMNEQGTIIQDSGLAQANGASVVTVEGFPMLETKQMLKIVTTDSIGDIVQERAFSAVPKGQEFSLTCTPNPFSTSMNIKFSMQNAKLKIFNTQGKIMHSAICNLQSAINSRFHWDAKKQPAGIYLVRVTIGDKVFNRRITLIK